MRTLLALLLACALGAAGARANVVVFGLSLEFSGATAPTGTSPWLTATIDDSFGGTDTVRLTVSASNLVSSEFVSSFFLNLNPTLNASNLTFVTQTNPSAPGSVTISKGTNAFKADGDGDYDLLFSFPTSETQRFGSGESYVVDITLPGMNLFAQDFLFVDAGGSKGEYYAAAHVQSIGEAGKSGWIGAPGATTTFNSVVVPEPTTYAALLGLATLGVAWVRRRR